MADYTVGDLVAEFLGAAGIETGFGIVSVHNIPMLDAIARRNSLRFVPSRHEGGAGHMADAYARASEGLGLVVTSTGPGAANVTGALVEARFASSPVLHLTGQTATGDLDRGHGSVHDVPDQLGMLKSVSKAAYRVRSAEEALGVLTRAAGEALSPPMGPVSVEIPIDVQRTAIARPEALDALALPVAPAIAGDPASLQRIADALAKARRPLLWCGTGAKRAGAAVARLADFGIPVVTSVNGRAVLPEDHAMALGAFAAVPRMEAFYDSVDLMLIAGGRLRGHETRDLTLALPGRRMQIDIDPAAQGRTYDCEHFHVGECAAALAALADLLDGRRSADAGWIAEIAALRAAVRTDYAATLGPYAEVPGILRAVVPADALWVRDITLNNSTWGNRLFPLERPSQNIYPVGAAIGPGLSLGIGAALAPGGRKTVVMTGDGGFAMHLSELWTATQQAANVTVMVMNDAGYGVIKHIQSQMYGERHHYADLSSPPLSELAALAGVPFFRVSAVSDLAAQMGAALAIEGPSLVEVDMQAIGAFPPYFAPPPYASATDEAEA